MSKKTHHSKQSSFLLQLSVLVLFLAIFTGFTLLNKENKPVEVQEQQIKEPVITQSSRQGWKVYTKVGEFGVVSFEFPDTWKHENSVFVDNTGKKVAESIGEIENNICKVYFQKDYSLGNREQLISQDDYKTGDFKGFKNIFKTSYENGDKGGIWYPNIYCLSRDNKSFSINFYENSAIAKNKKLYDQILSTLKFTN
ncbi:MAG: hypothetical protein Q7R44_00030 [bacterium]|nr:hypothetical protein [bacterium]